MRTINVKVLRDYESDNLRLEEGQIIEIEFHISGLPTYDGIELDNTCCKQCCENKEYSHQRYRQYLDP